MAQTQQRPPTLIPSVIAPAIQTGISSSQSLSERLWRRFATLGGRFRTLIIAIIVVSCLTALTVALSAGRAAGDLNTIGAESIPSITAAQNIVPYLEDIDARAADYLANTGPAQLSCVDSLTGQQLGQFSAHDCASKIIDLDQQTLNHQLFLAGQNAPFPGLSTALQQTQSGLETYIGDINLMRHEYGLAANPGNSDDPHMQQAYQAARAAQTVLLQQLPGRVTTESNLPSCTLDGQMLSPQAWPNAGIETNMLCLSALGKPRLDSAYNDNVSFFGISLGLVFGLSLYCCIFLVWSTWSIVSTTRKLFQPALFLALLVALLSTTVVLADFDAIYGHNGYFSVIANDYNDVYTAGTLQQEAAQVQANQARWLAALGFHDLAAANQWQQNGQARRQQVTASLQKFAASSQSSRNVSLFAKVQQDWKLYDAQVKAVTQQASSTGNATVLSQAERLHLNQASSAFQILTSDIQQFSMVNTNDYKSIVNEASARLASLTTGWAIIFPVLGVVGAWGISRRLKDF